MRTFKLSNVNPNGTEADIIRLIEIYNADHSGTDFEIYYRELDFLDEYYIGKFSLIDGVIWFKEGKNGRDTAQMSYKGLKLLYDWIEANLEQ